MNSIQKEKIQSIIDQGIKLSEGVSEGIVKIKEIEDYFHRSLDIIYNILEKDSIEYRKFDKWKTETHGKTLRRSPREEDKYTTSDVKIKGLIEILVEITGYKAVENERHFKAGDNYETIRYLSTLLKSSKIEILILDEYIDSNIFDFIEEIDHSISIKILTSKTYKPNFKNLYMCYKEGNLEAKVHNTSNHDRYIILDLKEIYIIGVSFNGIGKSDFTVKKLDDKEKIIYIYSLWNSGNIIT